ncbi:hypothetical protein BH24ACT26_BH24ACT26_15170 [soil metagenome]
MNRMRPETRFETLRPLRRVALCACALVLAGACVGRGDDAAESPCLTRGVTTESGLRLEDLSCGSGLEAKRGDTVTVDYVSTLRDGTELDSSRADGDPFTFPMGAGQLISGWEEGIPGMQVGAVRRLVVPPELAYGSSGVFGLIPPNATLIFEVEMVAIDQPG